ncbi:MAG TPA: phosphatidate cytidylyltransferase [Candidatus Brocadiaceae bacterium]
MSYVTHLHPHLLYTMGGILAIMAIATLVVAILKRRYPRKDFTELTQRVNSWWVMAGVFILAIALSRKVSVIFFAFVSFLALKEYFSIIETRRADRRVLFWAYLSILIQYFWIWEAWYGMFIIFIPVFMFLFLPFRMVVIGETSGYLKAAGTIHWGLMKTVFCMGHIAYLLVLPADKNPMGGGAALVLYLTFLTQFNDVSQYVWGKCFGKHKVVPLVSPGKTWEGLIGGVITTMFLAFFLAPYLTPLTRYESTVVGIMIGLGGFIGDITVSAMKRDLGLKDSGTLLPGHGGILDRINSLMYTAPLFFHYVYYLYY